MQGVHRMDKEDYYRYMDAQVAAMPEEKREALINAIKLIFRTFTEDDTQGVLILVDNQSCMTTMGLNATYNETARLVDIAMGLFVEAAIESSEETKH